MPRPTDPPPPPPPRGAPGAARPVGPPFGTGHYTEMVGRPLASDAAIASYRAPDPDRPELYEEAGRVIRQLGGEYYIVGVTVTTIWETAWALRGFEQMMIDLVAEPDVAEAILEIPLRYHRRAAERVTALGVALYWTGRGGGGG